MALPSVRVRSWYTTTPLVHIELLLVNEMSFSTASDPNSRHQTWATLYYRLHVGYLGGLQDWAGYLASWLTPLR